MADIAHMTLPNGSTVDFKDASAVHTVDSVLSDQSTNPVQNKVVTESLAAKANSATTLSGYGITDAYNKTQVDAMVAATYKAGGTIAFANLPALTSANLGYVYDISNDFTTTSSFVEGAGHSYPAGTNVAIVVLQDGTTYKYDVMSGFIDLSNYEPKTIISATEPTTVAEQYWMQDY